MPTTAAGVGGAIFSQVVPAATGSTIGTIGRPLFTTMSSHVPASFSSRFSGHDQGDDQDEKASVQSERPSYGWGTAGEKAAMKAGMGITRPAEALPPYGKGPRSMMSSPSPAPSLNLPPASAPAVHFASSGDQGI